MVFFDIDGTLIDHELAVKKALHHIFIRFHKEFRLSSYSDFYSLWHKYSEKCYQLYLAGKLDLNSQRKLRIRLTFNDPFMKDQYVDYISNIFIKNYEESCTLFPDVKCTLKYLSSKGIRLGIISNGDMEQQNKKLLKNNIINYFSVKVFSSDVGCSKPCQKIFLKALECCRFNDTKHYYIGDDFSTDIEPCLAENIPLIPVLISRGHKNSHVNHQPMIKSLKQLEQIIYFKN